MIRNFDFFLLFHKNGQIELKIGLGPIMVLVCWFGDSRGFAGVAPQAMRPWCYDKGVGLMIVVL